MPSKPKIKARKFENMIYYKTKYQSPGLGCWSPRWIKISSSTTTTTTTPTTLHRNEHA
jgi:hypothetical protein